MSPHSTTPTTTSSQPANSPADGRARSHLRRSWWLRQLMQWHWVSSAVCLIGMLLFALTGITLNHPNALPASTVTKTQSLTLAAAQQNALASLAQTADPLQPLPRDLRRWLGRNIGQPISRADAEWEHGEVYLAMPRPGGDAWLVIDIDTGAVEFEHTHRGSVAWLNDLHKGRNTGPVWSLFIDVFAVACVIFTLSGLFILWLHARQRPMVWPLVAAGALIPLLIILLFMH
ncbi:MAG: hypothetical protein EA348_07485 [Pseudomonadaceae bacterium]|nr:MAG: hypothetical protein EA348_07485 [Pseudomonadaceae bacterium]